MSYEIIQIQKDEYQNDTWKLLIITSSFPSKDDGNERNISSTTLLAIFWLSFEI
jgi:hypothetical protein